ncbi:MAG: hypothetical protein MJZ32_06170 [Bacteroidaceae bacterium]|nr:hypothetical protein [Bacteroidaceae bacterium]
MAKIISINQAYRGSKQAPDYMQLQTLNLLYEWQHYKHNAPSFKNVSLEQYIKRKYGFTANDCYLNYNQIRANIDNQINRVKAM